MCSNCNALQECDCTGGTVFVQCQCERGVHCPICNHQPAAHLAADPDLVMEICSPALLAVLEDDIRQVRHARWSGARAA